IAAGGEVPAYAFLPDGRNLAEVLLQDGTARRDLTRTHPQSEAFAAAEATAVTAQLGTWAQGTCAASVSADDRARMAAFVSSAQSALQQVHLGAGVLHQQALSAPTLAPTADWQRTTAMALGWIESGARALNTTETLPEP